MKSPKLALYRSNSIIGWIENLYHVKAADPDNRRNSYLCKRIATTKKFFAEFQEYQSLVIHGKMWTFFLLEDLPLFVYLPYKGNDFEQLIRNGV